MGKKSLLRVLRRLAKAKASTTGYANGNVQVKPVKNGKFVKDEHGRLVEEVVPITTYTSENKEGSYKKLYKDMKKEYGY